MIVAEREIFRALTRMLWACDMNEVPLSSNDLNACDGLIGLLNPTRFPINLKVRNT